MFEALLQNPASSEEAAHQLLQLRSNPFLPGMVGLQNWSDLPLIAKPPVTPGQFELARMIILHHHPDMTAGKSTVIALFFDMKRLFEQVVYQLLSSSAAKFERSQVTVSPQDEQYFWKDKTLRPDLTIEFSKDYSGGNRTSHRDKGDTKWKMIAAGDSDPHDLRQMFAYNIRYSSTRSVLIYPAAGQVSTSLANFEKFEGDSSADHVCEIYFMDLLTDKGEPDEDAGEKFIRHLIDTTAG